MGEEVAGVGGEGSLLLGVGGLRVIEDALAEAEGFGAAVFAHAEFVGAGDVADAAGFLVDFFEGEPHGEGFAGIEHEVVAVLVGRSGQADAGGLVEVLEVLRDDGAVQEGLGELAEGTSVKLAVEEGIVVSHLLELLEGGGIVLVFVKDVLGGHDGNHFGDEAIDVCQEVLEGLANDEAGHHDAAVPVVGLEELGARKVHCVPWTQSRGKRAKRVCL